MKALAVLLALILPPAAYFSTIAKQRERDQARAEQELWKLDRRVENARSAQQNMQKFLEDGAHLETELAQMRVVLPPKLSTGDILRTLEAAATRNGVTLTHFSTRPPTEAPPVQVVSVEAEAEGPQNAIEALLAEFAKPQPGQRFLTVSGITPSGNRTSFVLTGYALPDS